MTFSQEEWQKLFDTLCHLQTTNSHMRISIFSREEIESHRPLRKNIADEKIIFQLTAWMVRKLAMINELTFGYNYHLDRGEPYQMKPCIDLEEPSMSTLSNKKLFQLIGSIKYNCVSNGGSNFLPQEILEKMDRIQLSLGYGMAEEEAK